MNLAGVSQVAQPSPNLNPGGDCYACASLAIIKHLFPEEAEGLTVADAAAWWKDKDSSGNEVAGNLFFRGRQALHGSRLPVEVHEDQFTPSPNQYNDGCWPIYWPNAFSQRVEAYLSAGWVGLVNMHFAGASLGLLPDRKRPDGRPMRTAPDHMVVLDGHRQYWQRSEPGATSAAGHTDLHIVCSVRGPYWIASDVWVEMHGGIAIWWVRRRADLPYLDPGEAYPEGRKA